MWFPVVCLWLACGWPSSPRLEKEKNKKNLMSLRDVVAREKQTEGPGPASYVLVGGEAWNWHGVEPIKRQLSHTSVSFVCRAYNQLRELGVPPSSIITIVQLRDYLDGLNIAAQTEGVDSRLKIGYGFAHQSTLSAASRMLAEGGPTYDGKDVNPYTFWSVMNGEASGSLSSFSILSFASLASVASSCFSLLSFYSFSFLSFSSFFFLFPFFSFLLFFLLLIFPFSLFVLLLFFFLLLPFPLPLFICLPLSFFSPPN